MKLFRAIAIVYFISTATYAASIESCQDMVGTWKSPGKSHSYIMHISLSDDDCGENCLSLNVSYQLNDERKNKLFCYEGVEGVKGNGPMVMAFEGAYGGHSIATYNRQLKLLWSGVIPKNSDDKWLAQMDSYWFEKQTAF